MEDEGNVEVGKKNVDQTQERKETAKVCVIKSNNSTLPIFLG